MTDIGSLCTGYGGLDLAVGNVFGGTVAWCAENGKHPSTLLAQRFPWAHNYGDITEIDWEAVPRVDILTAGYPCQPFSGAGLKKGVKDDRHLWPCIREAVRVVRPQFAVFENVVGHRSNGFATVLRDCAADGLDVRWVSVRASDVGAPHSRERLFFIVADPATYPDGEGLQGNIVQPERYEPADQCGGEKTGTVLGSGNAIPWGEYGPAIRRWERIMNRPAPDPTEPNRLGRPRLTAGFHEWMMGLPEGWVTGVDIPYTAKIQLTGNGVVPQQAELAIRHLVKK